MKVKQYHVRSRETRVYDWYVVAASEADAQEWVEDQGGDTENASSDQFDSTEVIDVTETEATVITRTRNRA